MFPHYRKTGGGAHNPTWCREVCTGLQACAGWTYWAAAGDCWVFGVGLRDGQAPKGWAHGTGTGGAGVIATTTGTSGYTCYIKGTKGSFAREAISAVCPT